MNWHQIEVRWDQMGRLLKTQWSKLTDQDLEDVSGKKEQLIGKLQNRYGMSSLDAARQVDEWMATVSQSRVDRAARAKPMNG